MDQERIADDFTPQARQSDSPDDVALAPTLADAVRQLKELARRFTSEELDALLREQGDGDSSRDAIGSASKETGR